MSDMNKKVSGLLSMAAKAGKVASGGFMTEKSLQTGQACLVIIAEDASANTREKYTNKSHYYDVPVTVCGAGEELGRLIGKESRMTLAILDKGFADGILKGLNP